MERVRGFSPAQWALGRSTNWDQSFFDRGNETRAPSFLKYLQGMETARDAWLKVRHQGRLKRAPRARNRPLAHFRLGEEVDIWRRGKGKGTRPHIKGRFHGGAVVLATSTEIDEEDESRKPRRVVWIIHAGTLIKCALEHWRYSSERTRQLASMGQAQRLLWTHEGLDGWLRKRQYENLPMDATPDEENTEDEAEGLEDDSSAAWEYEIRQVKRNLEMQPSSSSSLAQPRDEAVLSQPVEKTHMQVEQTVRKVSKKPTQSKNQESRAVFWSMDVTSSASQQKRFVNRPGQFVASQLRERKVEVSVKNLSQDELQQLYKAKQNEKTSTLRGLWGAMHWLCTQTDAKRACAVSMLQSSLPVSTVRTLIKSNRILREMKSDMVEIRVLAHRDEKLAVVVWSDAAWAKRKDLSSTLGFFSGVTTTRNLQG